MSAIRTLVLRAFLPFGVAHNHLEMLRSELPDNERQAEASEANSETGNGFDLQ